MRRLYSILVLALLAGSAVSSLAMQTASGIHDEKPSGCHEHGKKAPAHEPADYTCCVAGHSSALVQASSVPHAQPVCVVFVLTASSLQPTNLHGEAVLQMYSGTPPRRISLRI